MDLKLHSKTACSAVLLLLIAIVACGADTIPPCNAPSGVASFSLGNLPHGLASSLKDQLGELVPPDAPFDATDVVVTGFNRRLIFIWNAGRRWIVATEHGGIGYSDPIFAYEVNPQSGGATLIAERTAFPDTVCATAQALLNVAGSNP